ncbi:unnamed protein product [Rotaria sp. Silwood1]|nr:unnamed protein product [Rotaria sp. Silwood1]CAF1681880.1 unnamed protein product [Rotaria sp. Silwood1]
MNDDDDSLSIELKYVIWDHVSEIQRAFELVASLHGKINHILAKLTTNSINEQEAVQQITLENKNMENSLAKILIDSATTIPQQTTSSLDSL